MILGSGNISLILPLPPSLNHSYVTTRHGKRIMTERCRNYKEEMKYRIVGLVRKPHAMLESISFNFYFPDYRRRDTDNLLKILKDCLKGTLVEDDCWRCLPKEYIESRLDKHNPRVEIFWKI